MPDFIKKSVTIDKELIDWIDEMIRTKQYGSFSHAVQKAIYEMKEREEKH